MDKLTRDYVQPGRVDLAREADFALGPLTVRPSRRVVEGAGSSHLLQRRVMQVLVALANSTSEVVSQRELILRCWDGLTVSDDAIARCIAQLRQLAGRWAEPPFAIETIPGVGYRLDAAGPPAAAPAATDRAAGRRSRRGLPLVAALAVAGAGVVALGPGRPAGPEAIAIEPVQVLAGGAGAKALANTLEDDLNGTLNETGVHTTPPRLAFPLLQADRPDLMLGGTATEDGGVARVRLYLEERRSRTTLWSQEIEGRADRPQALADQASSAATARAVTALQPGQQRGLKLSPHALALYIQGMGFVISPEQIHADEGRRDMEQVLAEAPDFADARGTYALTLAEQGLNGPAVEAPGLLQRAETEARRAIRTSPRNAGAAYDAMYFVQRGRDPQDIRAAENWLLAGVRAAPEFHFLQMRECQLLDEVGRAAEALLFCQRASAMAPLMGPIGWKYAMALYLAGQPQWAERQMAWSVRFNPAQEATRSAHFQLAALGPAPQSALPLLDDEATVPHRLAPNGMAAMKTYLNARAGLAGVSRAQAIAALTKAAGAGDLDLALAVKALARLDARDEVFALLATAAAKGFRWGGGIGFMVDPALADLRADPRYWAAARRLGLVRYWTEARAWPDFCSQAAPRLDCRALAASAPPA